jgi:pSer/pThr/pTyr-binding forkhead associated (FHA) protein
MARGETIPAMDLFRPAAAPAPAANAPAVQLHVLEGPERGRSYPVGRLPALIGRGSEAGVALDGDITVSRRHAEIYAQHGALRIRDLGSSHGTQVNGFNIQDKSLEIGDRITVGKSTLQVEP